MTTHGYEAHLRRVQAGIAQRRATATVPASPFEGAPQSMIARARALVERHGDQIVGLADDIHAHPEVAFAEHHAARALATLLEAHGISAHVGARGLDTAIEARIGSGRPRVALLAEYDALPGIGHACGHNVIAAAAAGALLVLAELLGDIDGGVVLYGTPAEEGGGGKETMARAGAFDDVDCALMIHPAGNDILEHPFLGFRRVTAQYRGAAAHAAISPYLGRSALDAAVQAYIGMTQLRQLILATDRVHGVFTDGGGVPNVIPAHAALEFYVRSFELDTLQVLASRANDVFEAAARLCGVDVDVTWDPTPPYLPVRYSTVLNARFAEAMADRGRQMMPAGVYPAEMTGSTDLGNVSNRVPSIHGMLAMAPADVAAHSPEFTAHAVGPAARRAVLDGAFGLAATALDYLTDADLRSAATEEFLAGGGVQVVEPIT